MWAPDTSLQKSLLEKMATVNRKNIYNSVICMSDIFYVFILFHI